MITDWLRIRREYKGTAKMEKYEIQKLRDLPIEKVAEEMGMKVEHHKALCPFHDDPMPASRSIKRRTAADAMSAWEIP